MSADVHFMLATEDRRDLLDSRALLAMPFGEGKMRISGRRAGETPALPEKKPAISAQVGEVVAGRWVPFEVFKPRHSPDSIELDVDPDRAVSLILLAPKDELVRVGERVARMLTEP